MMGILQVIGLVLLFILVVLLIVILIKGRGKPITLLDENGNKYPNGISVREKITLNNSEQYIFITGENRENPVLLFLHGGPGSPEVAFHSFEAGKRLEEKFVVCHWEQRGAGLSYKANSTNEKLSLEIMISDTLALTEYLAKHFNQEKIYIMGHSWGSFLGVKAVQEKPEYYHAYLGIGQVANQNRSELLAYDYMLAHAESIGDAKAIAAFKEIDPTAANFPTSKYLMSTRTKYMNKYGIGIMHEENFKMSKLLKQVFWFQGYAAIDFLKFALGNLHSVKDMNDVFTTENLSEKNTIFSIPVYIFQGKYDFQVSHQVAKEYFELIQAPIKEFYTFENSAHSPNFEESDKFLELVFNIVED